MLFGGRRCLQESQAASIVRHDPQCAESSATLVQQGQPRLQVLKGLRLLTGHLVAALTLVGSPFHGASIWSGVLADVSRRMQCGTGAQLHPPQSEHPAIWTGRRGRPRHRRTLGRWALLARASCRSFPPGSAATLTGLRRQNRGDRNAPPVRGASASARARGTRL